MSNSVVLIITISLIIIFSPFFARVFKLPTTPIEIIFGSILAYIGFLHSEHLFSIVAELGFLYLMFIAGTEINLKNVLKTPARIMKRVIFYLVLLYGLSIALSLYLDLGKIFMVLLPLISVGLVASLSKEYGKTPWLVLSMTAGGIGEVVSIGFLTLTSAALQNGFGTGLLTTISALILFLIFMFILFRTMELLFWWFPEVSTALMPHEDNKEQDIRLSMGIFFLLVGAMLYLHLELAFGAFLAGIFIPTFFEHKHELPEKLASYGFGFLIPIFFIHIGASFNLEALAMDGLITKALIIALAMILMRVLSSLVFIKELGLVDSILMGLSHSMPLTLLIAMATLAYNANSIDTLHYYAFILAALFQVISVMIVIKLINNYKVKLT
ncbi:MAG: cation:proton antiporter [Epsilonproteobacteria bacterium]|nr:cation:proton antiporter [Campylobacterota bacterium]OIO14211.1 MAG: sodium:proton antiporter [Helicobacteraceae bacterium CG1_02_36_14]PIP09933.1 MAG: sodium:proton antiporter [Sulfurimonas sp. CG23_combo_of_CG06-09_8_20_14_all_36_33]PIS26886.1 MAG: sodium:proton antiporter [Sulfurimonas sp. CG08_land_8_20_14_0_20_36_33]PIU34701.1 MAG: sodium:proton antiporter [Sulfurimonas sp. CG07_land_8_20_14_0_80_36_56]PIV03595.1 MAG: sodium:proton antiporter [Sulfurimonas sp. CG03_land_8_20_14_0_80_36